MSPPPTDLRRRALFAFPLPMLLLLLGGAAPVRAAPPLTIALVDHNLATEAPALAVMTEAYRRLGVDVVFKDMPAARALAQSAEGFTDGELQRVGGLGARIPALLQISIPINWFDVVVVTRDVHFTPDGWSSLRPYTIGFQRGLMAFEMATRGMKTDTATTFEQVLLKLEHDRTQVAVMPDIEVAQHLRAWTGKPLTVLAPPVAHVELYHYVNRRHQELVPRLEAVLAEMAREGTIAALRKHALAALPSR